MNISRSFFNSLALAIMLIAHVLSGCSSAQATTNQQIDAINKIRKLLELPDLPLDFVEMTGMINSPGGNLEVAHYQDSDERKYFVNPETNQVVEIDARMILSNISPNAPTLSADELKAKSMEYIRATISDFDSLQSSWQYEEGIKGDNYFFSWYGEAILGSMNRPFAQIGLHKSGMLFAYYNTILLEK